MVGTSVGNRGMIYPHLMPALHNQNKWCFRSKSKSHVKQAFVKFMLDSIVKKFMGLASGSARGFFRKGDFGNQNNCIRLESIQNAFDGFIFPIMNQQSILDIQHYILSKLRDNLLPRLLSGDIELNNSNLETNQGHAL